ncbi:glycosyltransferase [Oceanimonas smirnovii]|uniref:glycosyltransferase n=1 Tax=Oceanimonas smirnovii TaxID=264574 RepID=UPI003FD5E064
MTRHVLFVTDHMNAGGAPVVIRDLALTLDEQGIKVTIVILSDEILSHRLPDSIQIHHVLFKHSTWWQRHHRYTLHAKALDNWLEKNSMLSPDLTVAHLHYSHQVVSRSKIKKDAWYCIHSNPSLSFLGNKKGLSKHIKKNKVKDLYSNKNIIGVSSGVKLSLIKKFGVNGDNIIHIHNPVDIEKIRTLSNETISDTPEKYFLFVGRLEQRSKRFDRLLQAYSDSQIKTPLVIIGEGDAKQLITEHSKRLNIAERVFLLGARNNPYPYMKNAQALILSSDYEGFPLVIVEALACQTPVISTNCPTGPEEILTGSLSHYLVPLDKPDLFAKKLREVNDLRPYIADDVVSHLDRKHVTARYLELMHTDN